MRELTAQEQSLADYIIGQTRLVIREEIEKSQVASTTKAAKPVPAPKPTRSLFTSTRGGKPAVQAETRKE